MLKKNKLYDLSGPVQLQLFFSDKRSVNKIIQILLLGRRKHRNQLLPVTMILRLMALFTCNIFKAI